MLYCIIDFLILAESFIHILHGQRAGHRQGAVFHVTEQLTLIIYQRGIKLGIATSNKRELAEAVLRSTKVLPLFDSIWTSCEAKAGKPAPDVYLRVAQSLQVEPKRCLVFEDVPNGILAGVNAGMKVCAVEDDFSKNQDEKKRALADYYIKDYEDIKNNTYEVLK